MNSGKLIPLGLSQKIYIIKCYYMGGESTRYVLDALEQQFNITSNSCNVKMISEIVLHFEATGSVQAPFQYSKTLEPLCQRRPPPLLVVTPDVVESEGESEEILESLNEEAFFISGSNEEEAAVDDDCLNEDINDEVLSSESGEVPPDWEEGEDNNQNTIQNEPREVNDQPQLVTMNYLCPDCGRVSKSLKSFLSHQLVHSADRPFACPDCPMKFVRSQGLKRHRRTHTGEKPYVCSICSASFSAHMSHQMHVRLHTGQRPHQCQHCGDRFIGLPALNVHLRKHGGEYAFSCHLCSGRYKSESTLRTHVQRKHAVELGQDN